MLSLSRWEQQSQISLHFCSKIPNGRVEISKIPGPKTPFGTLRKYKEDVVALTFNRKGCKGSDPPYFNLADPLPIIPSHGGTIQRWWFKKQMLMYLSSNKYWEVSDTDCRIKVDQSVQVPTILDRYIWNEKTRIKMGIFKHIIYHLKQNVNNLLEPKPTSIHGWSRWSASRGGGRLTLQPKKFDFKGM